MTFKYPKFINISFITLPCQNISFHTLVPIFTQLVLVLSKLTPLVLVKCIFTFLILIISSQSINDRNIPKILFSHQFYRIYSFGPCSLESLQNQSFMYKMFILGPYTFKFTQVTQNTLYLLFVTLTYKNYSFNPQFSILTLFSFRLLCSQKLIGDVVSLFDNLCKLKAYLLS